MPILESPGHPYIGASPGCWGIFLEVVAREYGEYGYPSFHHLTVDTYAVQHPGTPSKQTARSVALHLISLYYALEKGWDVSGVREVLRQAASRREGFRWLEPPAPPASLTVLDVAGAGSLAEHEAAVRRWARSVWDSWAGHRETIRRWAER
ncbi:MAG: hypothetical protein Kow001_10190 [Acidobacteriota bacterium]